MTPEQFKTKFGVTAEEYADKMAGRLKSALTQRVMDQDAQRVEKALATLREELEAHFRHAVSEGIISDWTMTLRKDGTCQMQIESVKEFAETFRAKGFEVKS